MLKVDGTILRRKIDLGAAGTEDAAHIDLAAKSLAKEIMALLSGAFETKVAVTPRNPETAEFAEILQTLGKTVTAYQFKLPPGDNVIICLDNRLVTLAAKWSLEGAIETGDDSEDESTSAGEGDEAVQEASQEVDKPADEIRIADRRIARLLAERVITGIISSGVRLELIAETPGLQFETLTEDAEQLEVSEPELPAHNFVFDLKLRGGGALGSLGFAAPARIFLQPAEEDAASKAAALDIWRAKLREQVLNLPIAMDACLAREMLDVKTLGALAIDQTVPLKGASMASMGLIAGTHGSGAPFAAGAVAARAGARTFNISTMP